MKKIYPSALSLAALIVIMLVGTSAKASAEKAFLSLQVITDTTPPVEIVDKIYSPVQVDSQAEFPGGSLEWIKYVSRNMNLMAPISNGAPGGVYVIKVLCNVTKKGKLKKFRPQSRHGYGLEDEFVSALKRSPKWIPAKIKGKNVDSYTLATFSFNLNRPY